MHPNYPHIAVIHYFLRENFAGCGKMILGSDSHTRYGALGTMAVGEGGGGDLAGVQRVDGGRIDQQHAGLHVGQQAIVAEEHLLHMGGGRQHGDDHLDVVASYFGWRAERACAQGYGGLHGLGGKIEDAQVEAGLEQVGGHGPAHVAESDETDAHGDFLFFLCWKRSVVGAPERVPARVVPNPDQHPC